jgi:hypothetical protein
MGMYWVCIGVLVEHGVYNAGIVVLIPGTTTPYNLNTHDCKLFWKKASAKWHIYVYIGKAKRLYIFVQNSLLSDVEAD